MFTLNKTDKNENICGSFTILGEKNLLPNDFQKSSFISQDDKQQKMINDFDSSLILENIDKNVKNKAVRLNLKISTIERNLIKINEEYDLLKLLNLEKDVRRREELKKFKDYLENELQKLKSERKRFGIFYFLSGFFAGKIDYEKVKEIIHSLKNEIKKYDKAAISFIKSKNHKLIPFKW